MKDIHLRVTISGPESQEKQKVIAAIVRTLYGLGGGVEIQVDDESMERQRIARVSILSATVTLKEDVDVIRLQLSLPAGKYPDRRDHQEHEFNVDSGAGIEYLRNYLGIEPRTVVDYRHLKQALFSA